MALTTPSYPDASPSQTWPSPAPVISTCGTTYPLMYLSSAGGFPAALSCQSPTKAFGALIYIDCS